ncbi:NACHT domain-containing protein [Streptomyces sp. NPDC002073]
MTGFETLLAKAAGTAVSALVKAALGRAPGAGLAAGPAAPAPRWRRPATLGEPELLRLTEELQRRLRGPADRLPESERAAAVEAVRDAFAALGALGPDALFALDLDPDRLAAAVLAHTPPAGLSGPAQAGYRELVGLCCRHVLEYATTLPGFGARADVELVRRTGDLARSLADVRERLGPVPDAAAHAFEQRYAEYLAATQSRLELFGLTLGRGHREWPLDTAYISLAVSADGRPPGGPGVPGPGLGAPVSAEQALAGAARVLLRGPAGSGKSTLVQWLALNAARRSFGPELRDWNTCVPFVLRLRSFNSPGALPDPDGFLAAAGVPLHGSAPPGWTGRLLAEGRALVLVDGVDEVPQRLRNRAEAWLRNLIAAYPHARYVVTTRPSAVPDGWLAGQGFTTHSLLPMERDGIRTFIGHWHRAARAEERPDDLAGLDTYEASLVKAVTTRRDLGRLATNPLMCALLCALNRDRRMQLPRARKELYDAALDLLLVRRDTEREINGVEGVELTRDEQMVLLQRLAYWLIRNDQQEARRKDAVLMIDGWLDAMPQVRAQGTAEQVFSHLLIRSGVLREPAPGAVEFVHRTFLDYLGAKEAVESRDFGVLARNAYDDGWDDVVRMAVGHARPGERAHLLRSLLRHADRSPRYRSRLVLLAAACLEHAPELDPAVRTEIETRTAELLPPRGRTQAEELAKAGELVLEMLQGADELAAREAAATVRTAALVGGDRALEVIAGFRADERAEVQLELAVNWGSFDATAYVDAVLGAIPLPGAFLQTRTAEQVAELPRLRHITRIQLEGDHGIPRDLLSHRDLTGLFLTSNASLRDLGPLRGLPQLRQLGINGCPHVDLDTLRGLPLEALYLYRLADGLGLEPLEDLPALTHLGLDFDTGPASVGEIPVGPGLIGLALYRGAHGLSLDGLEKWPGLRSLTIGGDRQAVQLERLTPLPALTFLHMTGQSALDVATLLRHRELTHLSVSQSALASGLEPLRSLPRLEQLYLTDCGGPVDLRPLRDLDRLTVHVSGTAQPLGAHLFPPDRLVIHE